MIDVFKVGVHIGLTTNSSAVLGLMMRQLTGLHLKAKELEQGLGRVGKAAMGAIAVFAGGAIVKGLFDATKHAEKLNHELVKLQTGARLSDAQTSDASNLAFRVSRNVRGTDVAENVKMQRELFGVFGNMDTAQQLLPIVAGGSRAVSNFVDKDTDLAQIAIRALELRGHITKDHKVDPAEFQAEFNAMVRSIVASEGLVDPQKLFMFIRQAGPAARNMSGEQMWGMAPAVMNALGSGPAGTATMSLFQQFIGHVVAGKRVAVAMEDAGMLTPGKWKVERGGKVRMDQDAVPDQAGFMDHPFTWLHDHLQDMRTRKGKDGKPIDLLGIVQQIFQLSSRQTSARLINDIDSNWPILENEEKRWKRMPNPEVIREEQNDKDLGVNIHNLSEAWNNFLAALGKPGIPVLIGVLQKLTDALNVLQAAAINHPTIAADLFYLVGAIGALTALGGGLLILNVAWSPFVGGIRLLIRALTAAEATTAATTAGGLALGIRSIVAAIAGAVGIGAGVASIVGAVAAIAKIGSDHETPENRAKLEDLNKARRGLNGGPNGQTFDGFGPDGKPLLQKQGPDAKPLLQKQSFSRPGGGSGAAPIHNVIYMDGRKVAELVTEHQANRLSRSPSGTTGADSRITPSYPGRLVAV